MCGGSLEMLAKISGHSPTATAQHYAHLTPDYFGANAFEMVALDLTRPACDVVDIGRSRGELRQRIGSADDLTAERKPV